MSSEPIKTPRRRRLLVIALVALTMAGGIATYGIVQRARSAAQVKQWTDAQAIPTVALANVRRGVGERKLTLPGTIQPYYRAAIFVAGRRSGRAGRDNAGCERGCGGFITDQGGLSC